MSLLRWTQSASLARAHYIGALSAVGLQTTPGDKLIKTKTLAGSSPLPQPPSLLSLLFAVSRIHVETSSSALKSHCRWVK